MILNFSYVEAWLRVFQLHEHLRWYENWIPQSTSWWCLTTKTWCHIIFFFCNTPLIFLVVHIQFVLLFPLLDLGSSQSLCTQTLTTNAPIQTLSTMNQLQLGILFAIQIIIFYNCNAIIVTVSSKVEKRFLCFILFSTGW